MEFVEQLVPIKQRANPDVDALAADHLVDRWTSLRKRLVSIDISDHFRVLRDSFYAMRSPHRSLLSAAVAFWCTALTVSTAQSVAVFSQVFNGYERTRQADDTFKPERYTFGEGGCWNRISDPFMAKLNFVDVARVVANPLEHMNYLPAHRAEDAELLILVFWGSTQGSSDHDASQATDRAMADIPHGMGVPQASGIQDGGTLDSILTQVEMVNRERDRLDDQNARILGYTESVERGRFIQNMAMGKDVLAEVGENRYFVVLQAYDFKIAVKEKKLKLLWFARISVRERGAFAKALQNMAWSAAPYFGQDSRGLRRPHPYKGTVELGPLEVVGEEEPD